MMKINICLLLTAVVLATVQSAYVILPAEEYDHVVGFEESYPVLRARRSPEGSVDLKAILGPGKQGGVDATYTHQVWKGRNGQSFELNGGYSGQYGGGKPRHNFGLGGTFRF